MVSDTDFYAGLRPVDNFLSAVYGSEAGRGEKLRQNAGCCCKRGRKGTCFNGLIYFCRYLTEQPAFQK